MANEKITHIENFLPTDIQDNIENLMTDSSVFSWFLFPRTAVDFVDSDNVIETSQLVHQFLKDGEQNSDYLKDTFSVAEYLQKKINIKIDDWDRIKGNFLIIITLKIIIILYIKTLVKKITIILFYIM